MSICVALDRSIGDGRCPRQARISGQCSRAWRGRCFEREMTRGCAGRPLAQIRVDRSPISLDIDVGGLTL
eukprot:1587401-Alexandrium_andersonii.AAC.1